MVVSYNIIIVICIIVTILMIAGVVYKQYQHKYFDSAQIILGELIFIIFICIFIQGDIVSISNQTTDSNIEYVQYNKNNNKYLVKTEESNSKIKIDKGNVFRFGDKTHIIKDGHIIIKNILGIKVSKQGDFLILADNQLHDSESIFKSELTTYNKDIE